MGLFDIFRRYSVASASANGRVLVCSVGKEYPQDLEQDAAIYRKFFPETTVRTLPDAASLLQALAHPYAIAHILTSVDAQGRIAGSENTGTTIIAAAANAGTKLIWFAASNSPEAYIGYFDSRNRHINVVMTIERQGAAFPNFLEGLFERMQRGMKMPVAWNDIAPQIPGRPQLDTPEQIYAAGYGAATFF